EPGDTKANEGRWLYFEERVLAKTEKRILVETRKTDASGAKDWGIDNPSTGWRDRTETLVSPTAPLPTGWRLLEDKRKEEIGDLGLPGEKPTKAVRAIHRQLEYPEFQEHPDGHKKIRHVWYSHDVPVLGRAKQFPAQGQGERIALSWDKKLTAAECK